MKRRFKVLKPFQSSDEFRLVGALTELTARLERENKKWEGVLFTPYFWQEKEEEGYLTIYSKIKMNHAHVGQAVVCSIEQHDPILARITAAMIEEDFQSGMVDRDGETVYAINADAYCKYCYETHSKWDLAREHWPPAWRCDFCDHVTLDTHMQVES